MIDEGKHKGRRSARRRFQSKQSPAQLGASAGEAPRYEERLYSDFTILRRLARQAQPYWLHIIGVFLLSLLAAPLALLTPLPLKIAVDSVIGAAPLPRFMQGVVPEAIADSATALLVFAAALILLIALLEQLRSLATTLLQAFVGEQLVLEFRALLFRHAQRLSLQYHDARGSWDSIYRILWDASAIQNIAVHGVIPFITAGATVVGMIYVSAKIDAQLAFVALLVSPVLVMLARVYRRRLRLQWRELKKIESSAFSVAQESFSALRVVKVFGQEEREEERFVRHARRGVMARLRVFLAEGWFGVLLGVTTAAGLAGVLFLGVQHVQQGALTLGGLLVVMSYIGQLYGPLTTLGRKVALLQNSLSSAERVFTLLDRAPEVVERPDARSIDRAEGAVAFRNVSFAYSDGALVLENISFEARAGTRVGIAGKTGAGKTTLASLLARIYDPTEGTIRLDGHDLRGYKIAHVRDQFAIVLQETVLFSTSIAQNIAYARPSATTHDISAAAKAANAHDFIMELPDGYHTLVGERGMRLSGGERQRISLARAFLKDAPILILDEPTSSVDVGTEAGIMDAMARLMHGRTTFIIAHRLSTLESCDTLLVLDGGRLLTATPDVEATLKSVSEAMQSSPLVARETSQ